MSEELETGGSIFDIPAENNEAKEAMKESFKQPKKVEPMIYKFINDKEEEFYTKQLPLLLEEGLTANEVMQKGVITNDVGTATIEQFYAIQVPHVEVNLKDGVVIRQVPESEVSTWFGTSKEEAEYKMKDEMLAYYQTIMPQLIQKVQVLEGQQYAQPQQRPQQQHPQQRGRNFML